MKCSEWSNGDTALHGLMQIIQECMDQGLLAKGDVKAASMAIWGMVHGLVSLALRRRMDKLIEEEEIIPGMQKALTWFLNALNQEQ
jgi:hypothetical protein